MYQTVYSVSNTLNFTCFALFLQSAKKLPLAAAITGKKSSELADILCVPMGILFCALYLGQQDTGLGIGKIVEEGNYDQLMALNGLFYNLAKRQLVD